MNELALYDVTESCPIQFLSHSSVIYLVNLHINIMTLLCWATLLVVKCIDCAAFRLQYIGGTYQLHKLCGGNLNWTIHYIGNYNQGVAENECVSLFTERCCHCCKLPYK